MKHKALMTIAELSNYKETGRLEEVERLSAELARAWPDAVRSFEFGRSAEGRIMRALLISRSGALTPAQLRAQAVPLLMIQGGIHPGESDGKDAGFTALRDLLGRFLVGCPVASGSRCCSFPHSTRTATSASDAGIAPIRMVRSRPAGARRRKTSTSIATT